jgi:hypothetical protein
MKITMDQAFRVDEVKAEEGFINDDSCRAKGEAFGLTLIERLS